MSKWVELYADGSCLGNPGPGGWGCLLRYGRREKELSGCVSLTTNNRMELQAVISGFQALTKQTRVSVYSDSQYVLNGASGRHKRKVNLDLWKILDLEIAKHHEVLWNWTRGHAGHPENERVDKLANRAARKNMA